MTSNAANGWKARPPRNTQATVIRKALYASAEHRQARKAAIAAYRPGDPCCLCGRPMFPPTARLHLDHLPGTTTYRGLAHASCNIRDGARRGRARQGVVKATFKARKW